MLLNNGVKRKKCGTSNILKLCNNRLLPVFSTVQLVKKQQNTNVRTLYFFTYIVFMKHMYDSKSF